MSLESQQDLMIALEAVEFGFYHYDSWESENLNAAECPDPGDFINLT